MVLVVVAIVVAGETGATERLGAFGWSVVMAAEPTLEAVLHARDVARATDHNVVAVCSGAAAPLAAALAVEGTLQAVVSLGSVGECASDLLDEVRTPWLVLGSEADAADLASLELRLEKAAAPSSVVRYRSPDVTLDEIDARSRVVTWIEHWVA